MSPVRSAQDGFVRALADLDATLRSAEGWRDDQRVRLERAQLAPLRAAANTYKHALEELDATLDAARCLLE